MYGGSLEGRDLCRSWIYGNGFERGEERIREKKGRRREKKGGEGQLICFIGNFIY